MGDTIRGAFVVTNTDLIGLQVIVDKMVDYLRTTNDEVTKTEVVRRIAPT